MWTRQIEPGQGTDLNGFDLGFYQESRNGQEVVSHAGDLVGFHSDLHLMPKDHIGIFMSFNSIGKAGGVETVPCSSSASFSIATIRTKQRLNRRSKPRRPKRGTRFRILHVEPSDQTRTALRLRARSKSDNGLPDGTVEVSMLKIPPAIR